MFHVANFVLRFFWVNFFWQCLEFLKCHFKLAALRSILAYVGGLVLQKSQAEAQGVSCLKVRLLCEECKGTMVYMRGSLYL